VLETMSFEFMLSRCSRAITGPLSGRYAISQAALHCFELHSKVDKWVGICSSAGLCQLKLRTSTAEGRCAAGVT
jgi:hypothetical protein